MTEMNTMDKVEQIREKCGCTYEEAKNALDAADGDVLDAVIALEREGKVKTGATATASTSPISGDAPQDGPVVSSDMMKAQAAYEESTSKGAFKKDLDSLWEWLKAAASKSWEVKLVGTRKGDEVFILPILVVILGLLCTAGSLLFLFIIGLFFGFRYHFVGIKNTSIDINEVMDKAADKAEDIKEDFKKNE